MNWISSALERLARQPICGYLPNQSAATEPTALAALSLSASSHTEPALQAGQWLVDLQSPEGSIGVRPDAAKPRWPTALAILTWQAVGGSPNRFTSHIDKALNWSTSLFGKPLDSDEDVGHRGDLRAWPWVEGTHSWIEPTALHVLALKASGLWQHPRVREAVELLCDRQLPRGGCNYGNTFVLGQVLRPHVQPTGLAMLALAGEEDATGCIERSLAYLEKSLSEQTTIASLCWGLMGLTAHNRRPPNADSWLQIAANHAARRRPVESELALLVLASLGERCPLVSLPARSAPQAVVS